MTDRDTMLADIQKTAPNLFTLLARGGDLYADYRKAGTELLAIWQRAQDAERFLALSEKWRKEVVALVSRLATAEELHAKAAARVAALERQVASMRRVVDAAESWRKWQPDLTEEDFANPHTNLVRAIDEAAPNAPHDPEFDRVGRVIRAMATWTDECRCGLVAEIARRWPDATGAAPSTPPAKRWTDCDGTSFGVGDVVEDTHPPCEGNRMRVAATVPHMPDYFLGHEVGGRERRVSFPAARCRLVSLAGPTKQALLRRLDALRLEPSSPTEQTLVDVVRVIVERMP